MILNYIKLGKQNKGSSLNFSASGGWDKEKKEKAAEKIAVGSEGEAEGGVWGEFRLARAEAKPRRPARSEQSPAKKFSFPFRRKRNRAPNQKMRRKIFCGTASEASGGGAERSNFAVRIFVKKSSDFVQQIPPN